MNTIPGETYSVYAKTPVDISDACGQRVHLNAGRIFVFLAKCEETVIEGDAVVKLIPHAEPEPREDPVAEDPGEDETIEQE